MPQQDSKSFSDYKAMLAEVSQLNDSDARKTQLSRIAVESRNQGWGYDDIAIMAFEEILKICREQKNREEEAIVLTNIAVACYPVADYAKALVVSEQALAIYRELGHQRGELGTLLNIAQIYANHQVNIPKATKALEQAIKIQRQIKLPGAGRNYLWLWMMRLGLWGKR